MSQRKSKAYSAMSYRCCEESHSLCLAETSARANVTGKSVRLERVTALSHRYYWAGAE
jgi:hypothetical protein